MSWKVLIGFHQTYTSDLLLDYRTEMNALNFGVKVQGHGGITYAGTTGRGIQYLTFRVELDFLVFNSLYVQV